MSSRTYEQGSHWHVSRRLSPPRGLPPLSGRWLPARPTCRAWRCRYSSGSSPAGRRSPRCNRGDLAHPHLARARTLWGAFLARRPLPLLHHPCAQPLSDEPQDPAIRYPVLDELHHPAVVDSVVKSTDVCIKHPVHLLAYKPGRQRIQRIMLASPRPEPVRETDEVRLVNSVEHLDDGPLDNLVLQRGNAERPLPPVRLRDVHPPRRFRSVRSPMQPGVQLS